MSSIADDFAGTGALSANWGSGGGAASRVAGLAVPSSAPALYAWIGAGTPGANQRSSFVLGALASACDLFMRFNFVSGNGYALLVVSGGSVFIARYAGYSPTAIETLSSITQNVGDAFELRIIGSRLRAFRNGEALGAGVTDTTYATAGNVGWLLNSTGDKLDAWDAADVVAASVRRTILPLGARAGSRILVAA